MVVRCATCGQALDGDPDEDVAGDAGRPICGNCARERDFFDLDIADGEFNGRLDPRDGGADHADDRDHDASDDPHDD